MYTELIALFQTKQMLSKKEFDQFQPEILLTYVFSGIHFFKIILGSVLDFIS